MLTEYYKFAKRYSTRRLALIAAAEWVADSDYPGNYYASATEVEEGEFFAEIIDNSYGGFPAYIKA